MGWHRWTSLLRVCLALSLGLFGCGGSFDTAVFQAGDAGTGTPAAPRLSGVFVLNFASTGHGV